MAARRKDREQGIYRRVTVRMWGDAKVMALSKPQPCGQVLWFHLLTGEQTDIIPGLCKIGEAAFAEQLAWPVEAFREAFAEVSRLGMVKADWNARVVWVPKAIEHNAPASPNVVTSWADAWDRVPECALKLEAWRILRAFLEGMSKAFVEAFDQACPKPSPMPSGNQEQDQEQDQREAAAPAADQVEASKTGPVAPPIPPPEPAALAEAPRPPAAASPAIVSSSRRLDVEDAAGNAGAGPPLWPRSVAFRVALTNAMARTALYPVGGREPETWSSLEASLAVIPEAEAVELCQRRILDAIGAGRRQPSNLAYFAQVLADEAVRRRERVPAPVRQDGECPRAGDPDFNDPDAWPDFESFTHRNAPEVARAE